MTRLGLLLRCIWAALTGRLTTAQIEGMLLMSAKDDFLASVANLSASIDRAVTHMNTTAADAAAVDQAYADAKAQIDTLTARLDAVVPPPADPAPVA